MNHPKQRGWFLMFFKFSNPREGWVDLLQIESFNFYLDSFLRRRF